MFALVMLTGILSTNPAPAIDASLRFNDMAACLAAKAVLEAEVTPMMPREAVSLYIEFHCVADVS